MNFKNSPDIGARVVIAAAKFVGLTEVRSNAEWDILSTPEKDALSGEFLAELLRSGWKSGWPYCAAFCEAVWRKAYQGRSELPLVQRMLTPGCLVSFNNAAEHGWTSQTPVIGAIGIMRKGQTSAGHAFIVTGIKGDTLHTIEANTSPAPSSVEDDRNGDGVYRKTRKLLYKPTAGLHLIGFIVPKVYA